MANYPNPNPQAENIPPTPSSTVGYPGYTPPGYQQQPSYQQPGYQQPSFPQTPGVPGTPGYSGLPGYQPTPTVGAPGALPFFEQSYIENILRLNRGKVATVYMNFENSQWGSKVFKGVIEAAGKDHIILSDPVTGMRYLLLSIYLNYITFDEEIAYEYPFGANPDAGIGTAAPIFNVPNQSTQFRKKEKKE